MLKWLLAHSGEGAPLGHHLQLAVTQQQQQQQQGSRPAGKGAAGFKKPRTGGSASKQGGEGAAGTAVAASGAQPEAAAAAPAGATAVPPLATWEDICAAVRHTSQRFGLNGDQAAVLAHVASWLWDQQRRLGGGAPAGGQQLRGEQQLRAEQQLRGVQKGQGMHHAAETIAWGPGDGTEAGAGGVVPPCQPPVCLIHGPFGSGKSTLLVALVCFITEQVGAAGCEDCRGGSTGMEVAAG